MARNGFDDDPVGHRKALPNQCFDIHLRRPSRRRGG
jgi:hypothetical protein